MRNDPVAEDLRAERGDGWAIFPDYGELCFANVPDTVLSVLGGDARRPLPDAVFEGVGTDVENVVVVLLDGFGFEAWRRFQAGDALLSSVAERGAVTPLTSIYPSETAAAISTMHTGRQPVEHGLLGWNQYVPDLDAVLQTLPFATLDDEPATEAFGDDADPRLLLDTDTIYQRAADAGVDSRLVAPGAFEDAPYDSVVKRGAETAPYGTVAEAALRIRQCLTAASGPTYVNAYVPTPDATGHEHGNESPEYRANLGMVTDCLRRELVENLDPAIAERTLLVLTADHGQVDTDPARNVDLGGLDVEEHLRRDGSGEPIPALGGPRNLQFHVRDGHVEALRDTLESSADADLRTFAREEYLDLGLFGDREPSARFEERSPDLVAVPRELSVWYDDGHLEMLGMHGGLNPTEMLVPFAAVRLDALQE